MKKGMTLDVVTSLIIGIVFLGMVILLFMFTGLFNTFLEQLTVFICTFSSYSRGILLEALNILVGAFIPILIGLGALSAATAAASAKMAGLGATIPAAAKITGAVSVSSIIGILFFTSIGMIPFICPTVSTNIGVRHSEEVEVFAEYLGSRTVNTYNMLGGGNFNPLWGLDQNPRTFYAIHFQLDETTNMSHIFQKIYAKHNQTWGMGTPDNLNIHLYCPGYETNNPENWGDCEFEKETLYTIHIMFLDKHPYDFHMPYSSDSCNMRFGILFVDFPIERDTIIWCVENL